MDKQALYKRQIIKHLYFSGESSCADLSSLTQKSVPLTARILNELMDEGAVVEKGYAQSTGGRRPLMYSLKPDLLYVVSVAMDQLITRIAMMDMHGTYIGKVEIVELALPDNPNALRQLTDHIIEFINKSGISKDKITGIGIGMPGFVDVVKGVNHSYMETKGYSIVDFIGAETGLPVRIDNDSSLVALAEQKFGAVGDKQNVMVLSVGWGTGLGMILNGKLFRGDSGFAGELSHIPLFMNNKMCSCGKSGCLETETSLVVVVEKAIRELESGRVSLLRGITLDCIEAASNAIMDAAQKGDRLAVELLSETAYNIGRGVAVLIHLLNPKSIIVSGRGTLAGKLWLAPIQQAINEHCIPKIAENVDVSISSIGFQAETIGAAALVMEHYDTTTSAKGRLKENVQVV